VNAPFPAALLALDRFAGRIRIDDKGNAVFPHFDEKGLSGYELKNVGFTGFASGGSKALWLSHARLDDHRLVITESAIDALSHAVLFPDNRARYASIGGKPNPQQPELIRSAAAMPRDSEIVSAMDNDADGAKLADVVRKAVSSDGPSRSEIHVAGAVRLQGLERSAYAQNLNLFFPIARRCLRSPDGIWGGHAYAADIDAA
jgi:hypothetical protein